MKGWEGGIRNVAIGDAGREEDERVLAMLWVEASLSNPLAIADCASGDQSI
jgi:hypothetical protein